MPEPESAALEIEWLSRQLTMLERVSEMASIGGWRFDFATREVLWSDQTRRIHGVDAQFVPNETNIFQFYVPEKRDAYIRDIVRFNRSGQPYAMDIEILTAGNRRIWTRVQGETQVVDGQAVSVWGTIQDITLQKNLELQLQASEARFRSLTDLSSDWYWETDESYRFVAVQASRLRSGAGVVPLPPGRCWWDIPADNMDAVAWDNLRLMLEARAEFRDIEIHTADSFGTLVWVAVSGAAVLDSDGRFTGYRGVGTNITERKSSQLRIEQMAFYDALTGLPNRRMLLDRLKLSVGASARHGQHGALLFIDLDKFKTLNDTLGHAMGDALLCQVAQRLLGCVRKIDTVARFGGDEFVVMLEELGLRADAAADMAAAVGTKILAAINSPFLLEGPSGSSPYDTSPSIGVTVYNGQVSDLDALLQQADLAMYASKAAGRNTLRFYEGQSG